MPEIEFLHPASIDEAVAMLASHAGSRCLAGGQTLVAMMNAGLVEIPALVTVAGIAELREVTMQGDGGIRIGAAVCHRDVARHPALTGANAVVREAAATIAHPAIRNFGTIGGSLAHADPAADYPTAAVAAGASIEIAGATGRRTVPAEEFFLDYLTTVLEPGELVSALLLPRSAPDAAGHYLKFSRVDGDYAIASVGVTLAMDNGRCTAARIALGGCAAVPVFSAPANAALVAGGCDDAAVAAAAAHLIERVDPVDDVRASASYRRAVLPNLIRRAIRTTVAKTAAGAKP